MLTIERDTDGKMRVTARHWNDAKVLGGDEVLEIRNVDGVLHNSRMREFGRRVARSPCSC